MIEMLHIDLVPRSFPDADYMCARRMRRVPASLTIPGIDHRHLFHLEACIRSIRLFRLMQIGGHTRLMRQIRQITQIGLIHQMRQIPQTHHIHQCERASLLHDTRPIHILYHTRVR